ncbi:MAG: hypothetical protein ABEH61_01125, partial [Haloarculaceae archaeon]
MSESTESASLSASEQEILRVARENPEFSIAGIAEATGHRVPLVRDTLSAHGDQGTSTDTSSSPEGTPIDSASFNATESAVLETALRNPEATNAEIAATVDTTVGLVRDIRDQYEDDATLPEGTQETAPSDDTTGGGTATAGADLSEAQTAILAAAEEAPEATNAEIAEQTGSRLTLVRDTLAAHGDEIDAEQPQSAGGSTPVDSASFNDTESAVLAAALREPSATNAEIAARVGAHVGLVRDIRDQYEDEATLPDDADPDSGADAAATSESPAGGMEFDTKLLSAAQEEILDRARENPELSNAEIAERTGHRLPLVRDTRAEHGHHRRGGGSEGGDIVKPTDSASFNDTEAAVLEAALRSPEATNAEIAERVGVHVGLVRDIRQQYEDDATLAGDSNQSAAAGDSTAEGDSAAESDSAAEGAHDHDTSDLSSTQQAILDTAAANPDDSYAEIADAVDARLPLVRDTLEEYGEEATTTAATADTSTDDEEPAAEAASGLQQKIIELARENPELTNAEIAERTGARVALVRDTRE